VPSHQLDAASMLQRVDGVEEHLGARGARRTRGARVLVSMRARTELGLPGTELRGR
jgi:hypothetical protein